MCCHGFLTVLLLAPAIGLSGGCDKPGDQAKQPSAQRAATRPASTATADNVEEKVIRIVGTILEVDKARISRGTSIADFKLDELDRTELIMDLEDTFNLKIPDEDALKLITVGQMIDYVQAHRR
jgi:acyl carrier protein